MISVVRSKEPPASLARGTYTGEDTRVALHRDFLGKCYLCERVLSGSWQVEHRLPKSGRYADQVYDWTNLYPADSCNQCRPTWAADRREAPDTAYPVGGLLDPTNPEHAIHDRIEQYIDGVPVHGRDLVVVFSAVCADDEAAKNTTEELRHIHESIRENGRTLREEIHAKYTRVLHACLDALQGQSDDAAVRVLLRKDSAFAGVLRGTMRRRLAPSMHARFGL